jgi:hypothetical protein
MVRESNSYKNASVVSRAYASTRLYLTCTGRSSISALCACFRDEILKMKSLLQLEHVRALFRALVERSARFSNAQMSHCQFSNADATSLLYELERVLCGCVMALSASTGVLSFRRLPKKMCTMADAMTPMMHAARFIVKCPLDVAMKRDARDTRSEPFHLMVS